MYLMRMKSQGIRLACQNPQSPLGTKTRFNRSRQAEHILATADWCFPYAPFDNCSPEKCETVLLGTVWKSLSSSNTRLQFQQEWKPLSKSFSIKAMYALICKSIHFYRTLFINSKCTKLCVSLSIETDTFIHVTAITIRLENTIKVLTMNISVGGGCQFISNCPDLK